ncbi:Krr1-domain-containing protein [Serendipita vermifera]|nr:Krr1-domain-containing protein [Serendipita vermifera]
MLSDSEYGSEGDDLHQITVNEHFAKAYQSKKEREELQKLKEKYGSDAELDDESEDSEEDESEDEDGEELTPAMDVAMLRTLALIKNKDPSIYDAQRNVFEDQQRTTSSIQVKRKAKDKTKALHIKQHVLNSILNEDADEPQASSAPMTYAQEQEHLKAETIRAFKDAVSSEDEDDLLVAREKTRDEIEIEEEQYQEFLRREVGPNIDLQDLITVEEGIERIHEDGEGDTTIKGNNKKSKKSKDHKKQEKRNEETDRDFLLNYILNRGWIDRDQQRIPTYDEITNSKKSEKSSRRKKHDEEITPHRDEPETHAQAGSPEVEEDLDSVDEEDDFDDLTERFESSYNFRFEEPGSSTIATHPRNLPSLVRRQDTSRKEAREKRKQRKEEEKAMKKEEVNRLKALKMREIREKVERIEREGGKGVKSEALRGLEEDLDEEWDPAKHDRQMREMYDEEEFYGVQDDEKPQWADDIDITDIIGEEEVVEETSSKKKRKRKGKGDNSKEDNFGAVDMEQMDADIERDWDWEEANFDGTEDSRKRLIDKYMDEIYGLEFNDMVGDLATRFKYTTVPANSYALDPVEILMASDKELNEYMSIKRIAPYKNKAYWDKERNEKLKEFKNRIGSRTWDGVPIAKLVQGRQRQRTGGVNGDGLVDGKKKKRMGKKERNKFKAAEALATEPISAISHPEGPAPGNYRAVDDDEARPSKRRKKNKVVE